MALLVRALPAAPDGLEAALVAAPLLVDVGVALLERGTFEAWERLTGETPESVLDLLEVEGVGLKTAATLYQQFKVSSLEDLRKFVDGGGLDLVDGVGEKSAERIARSVRDLTR
ncbi:MAG TPA: helix-hairpin-helix domain-containing protein [Pyrinomonadaceae bacterium]|nr:helix-hairpin-helix domain-containing protein [Pyrinomonadaceae bacterium]